MWAVGYNQNTDPGFAYMRSSVPAESCRQAPDNCNVASLLPLRVRQDTLCCLLKINLLRIARARKTSMCRNSGIELALHSVMQSASVLTRQ